MAVISEPTAADIHAAAHAVMGALVRTPCLYSRTLSELTGAEIFVKFENLQYTASFKERGALNALLHVGRGPDGHLLLAQAMLFLGCRAHSRSDRSEFAHRAGAEWCAKG